MIKQLELKSLNFDKQTLKQLNSIMISSEVMAVERKGVGKGMDFFKWLPYLVLRHPFHYFELSCSFFHSRPVHDGLK